LIQTRTSAKSVVGAGGYALKKDEELVQQTKARHIAERKAAIEADKTGEGFIYFMFLHELDRNYYFCKLR